MQQGNDSVNEPVIGVIGGMGPGATVEYMRRVIEITPAQDDEDHIRMLVDNNPKVPSRIKALIDETGESPGPALADMAKGLERAGADFLVIPCNTAHYYWDHVAGSANVPVWHLVDLTLKRAVVDTGTTPRIGMLASPALRKIGLYEGHCGNYGVELLYPEDEDTILALIRAVKAGRFGNREAQRLNGAVSGLVDAGASTVVLACTEFSLVSQYLTVGIPVLDSLQILAEDTVEWVKGQENAP